MMRSMFSGVSGMRIHQTKMDVIANNISNVNTNGYKSSRVTFSEIFSQTTAGAAGPSPEVGRGGVNAMQIGLGGNVASIDMLMTNGAAQRTDNPYDLMLQGEGFFVVSDSGGTYFTRAGAFRLDEAGNLVNPEGLTLNGWKANTVQGQTIIEKTGTKPIQITGDDEYAPPKVTSLINLKGNLNAITDPVKETSMTFFDSLGNEYQVPIKLEYIASSKSWETTVGSLAYLNGDKTKAYNITYAASGTADPTKANAGATPIAGAITIGTYVPNNTGTHTFPPLQKLATNLKFTDAGKVDPTILTSLQFTVGPGTSLNPNAKFADMLTLNFENLTQYESLANATSETKDGNKAGTLNRVSVSSDGKVVGSYSNGDTRVLWQISIAKFKNPAGLERVGSNLYAQTINSGMFDGTGEPIGNGTKLLPGVLEMSNVDLAQEFTEMITTQRGFQANSRVITTSDDMLQELVNLKR